MKMKKIFLITAALAVCCLVGCENKQNVNDISDARNVADNAEINVIEPPENGWATEQLNEVLYMNGQKIELPLMFSTLKDGYEIKEKEYYDSADHASGVLYYNGQLAAIISFYEQDDDYKITNLCFASSYYESGQDYSDYFIINGFGLKDNTSNIQKYLGDKFVKDSGFYKFIIGNDEYTLLVSDNEENYMIMVYEGVYADN